MSCLNVGFQGGAGGGATGNLSGDLTAPFLPVATGAHALADSVAEQITDVAGDLGIRVNGQIVIGSTTKVTPVALAIVAGDVDIDAADSDLFTLAVTDDCDIQPPSNPESGRKFLLRLKFDGLGAWVINFNASYRFAGGTPPTFDTSADSFTYLGFMYNEDAAAWDCIGSPIGPFA